jgi:hypothetical protein
MWKISLVDAVVCFLGAFLCAFPGAQADGRRLVPPFWLVAEEKSPSNPIGVCWIEEDGTVVLDLRRTADGINISMPLQRFARTHPRYEEVLRHVGPLRPGEVKLVEPWPD